MDQTSSNTVRVVEGGTTPILCPHCHAPLTSVRASMLRPDGPAPFRFGKRYLYACSGCHTALGVSHRKGFWMG